MAVATTTALLLGLAGAGVGVAASKMMAPKQSAPTLPALPQPPSLSDTSSQAADTIRKRKAAATQSIYTSPLGVSGQADVTKKTLLGQ